jgi:hypothetical protein
VSARNQFKQNQKIETIKKNNQILKNKITKNIEVKKSKTNLFHSFQKSGVSTNKTELSKPIEHNKTSKSKGVRLNSKHPAKMSLKDKVKHNNLSESQHMTSESNPKDDRLHNVSIYETKLNQSEISNASHIPLKTDTIHNSALKRRSKSLDKIPFSRVVGVRSKVKNIVSPFINFTDLLNKLTKT